MVYQGEPSGDTSSDDSDASSGSDSGSDEEGSDSEDGSSSASTSDEEFEDVDDDEGEGAGDVDGEANTESGAPLEAITEENEEEVLREAEGGSTPKAMSPEKNERSNRLDSAASVAEEVSSALTESISAAAAAAVEEAAVVLQSPQPESLENAVVDDGMFHHREKCRNQHLPTTVLLKPILDDLFLTEARELAGLEAAALHLF